MRWLTSMSAFTRVILGLVLGVFAGLLSVWPAVRSAGGEIPYATLLLMTAAIAAGAFLSLRVASVFAMRGPLLDALRQE